MNLQKINKWRYTHKGKPNLPETESKGKMVFWEDKLTRIEKRRWYNDFRWYGWLRFAKYLAISSIIYFPILYFVLKADIIEDYTVSAAWSFGIYFLMYLYAYYFGEKQLNSSGAYSHHRDAHTRDLLVMAIIPLAMYVFNSMFVL